MRIIGVSVESEIGAKRALRRYNIAFRLLH